MWKETEERIVVLCHVLLLNQSNACHYLWIWVIQKRYHRNIIGFDTCRFIALFISVFLTQVLYFLVDEFNTIGYSFIKLDLFLNALIKTSGLFTTYTLIMRTLYIFLFSCLEPSFTSIHLEKKTTISHITWTYLEIILYLSPELF